MDDSTVGEVWKREKNFGKCYKSRRYIKKSWRAIIAHVIEEEEEKKKDLNYWDYSLNENYREH